MCVKVLLYRTVFLKKGLCHAIFLVRHLRLVWNSTYPRGQKNVAEKLFRFHQRFVSFRKSFRIQSFQKIPWKSGSTPWKLRAENQLNHPPPRQPGFLPLISLGESEICWLPFLEWKDYPNHPPITWTTTVAFFWRVSFQQKKIGIVSHRIHVWYIIATFTIRINHSCR